MNTKQKIEYLISQLRFCPPSGILREGLERRLLSLHMAVLDGADEEMGVSKSEPPDDGEVVVEEEVPAEYLEGWDAVPPAESVVDNQVNAESITSDSEPVLPSISEEVKVIVEEAPSVDIPLPVEVEGPPREYNCPVEARKIGPAVNLLGAPDVRVTEEKPKSPSLKSNKQRLPKGMYTIEDIPEGWITIKEWLAEMMEIPLDELSQSLGTSFSMHCRPYIEKIAYFMTGEGSRMMTRQYHYPPAIRNYLGAWYEEWLQKDSTLERLRQENLIPLPPKFGTVSFMSWVLGRGVPTNGVQQAANMFYEWLSTEWSRLRKADRVKFNTFDQGEWPQYLNGRWNTKDHLQVLYNLFYKWEATKGASAYSFLNFSKGKRMFGPSPIVITPLNEHPGIPKMMEQIVAIDIDSLLNTHGKESKAMSAYLTRIKIIVNSVMDVSTGVALSTLRDILLTKLSRTIALRAQGFRWGDYCNEYLKLLKEENEAVQAEVTGLLEHPQSA